MSTLLRFTLRDDDGVLLPGFSVEMAGPGETVDDCFQRLKREFGNRLASVRIYDPAENNRGADGTNEKGSQ
jgi:hypothetical protein